MKTFYSSYKDLPHAPGVYLFFDSKGTVLYVGKAIDLKNRVSSYFIDKHHGPKTKLLVSHIDKISSIKVNSEFESLLLEARLIKKFDPKFNSRLTDGKAYPFIRITMKDDLPKVLISRRDNEEDSIYFGPFPSSRAMYSVLKVSRKIFPFQAVNNHPKKKCLYFHLGLCPCPPLFQTELEKKNYKKNLKRLKKFLEGNTEKVIKEFEKERNNLSKNEEFEKAENIQKKIEYIKLITSPVTSPFRYEENISLLEDLSEKEMNSLKDDLKKKGFYIGSLKRIECFDISNISGKSAVGSMVVFINGRKEGAEYRRFKIKNPPKVIPNDFAMMEEVLTRRLKRKDWEKPDLIVLDGGKGQVSVGNNVLKKLNLEIPLIGLAKREEIIILQNLQELKLSRENPGLKLLMRIRDEAHRFAITYHKKLRSKFISS